MNSLIIICCQGDCDTTVAYEWGKMTSDYIKTFNANTHTFKTYSGLAHSSSAEVSAASCVVIVHAWVTLSHRDV